ncbi:hypothetical protein LOC68_00420 [Blastopirellula sp. JC732]|uniref:Uncharacterized protein n=1 Tax=Blastopirellula sediminis TaxID=2894196 RepID=A0A9X1MJ41_9BACT|nr:hypothetical protein [Blastopirellula sediminis]MCC9604337.1 hypothetical protein [Blastopirellula sediminis]MCC9626857.1 hypothetical protein [Blastopirellula sediminis]
METQQENPFASPVADAHVANTPRVDMVDWYALPVRRCMLIGGVVGGLVFLAIGSPHNFVRYGTGSTEDLWERIGSFLIGAAAGMMVGGIAGNIVGVVVILVRHARWRTVAHALACGIFCPGMFVGTFLVLSRPVPQMTLLTFVGFSCLMLLVGVGAGIYTFRGLLRLSTEGSPLRRPRREPKF